MSKLKVMWQVVIDEGAGKCLYNQRLCTYLQACKQVKILKQYGYDAYKSPLTIRQ